MSVQCDGVVAGCFYLFLSISRHFMTPQFPVPVTHKCNICIYIADVWHIHLFVEQSYHNCKNSNSYWVLLAHL